MRPGLAPKPLLIAGYLEYREDEEITGGKGVASHEGSSSFSPFPELNPVNRRHYNVIPRLSFHQIQR